MSAAPGPFVRFSRDKRGYESIYLMHVSGRPARSRVLYWFRTPPGVKIGRSPFDEQVQRALEAQYPDIRFDWKRIIETEPPPIPEVEHWRERRRAERSAKQARQAALRDRPEAPVEPVEPVEPAEPVETVQTDETAIAAFETESPAIAIPMQEAEAVLDVDAAGAAGDAADAPDNDVLEDGGPFKDVPSVGEAATLEATGAGATAAQARRRRRRRGGRRRNRGAPVQLAGGGLPGEAPAVPPDDSPMATAPAITPISGAEPEKAEPPAGLADPPS